eukprot:8040228-Lingulodinium_polyedra.AAC.1
MPLPCHAMPCLQELIAKDMSKVSMLDYDFIMCFASWMDKELHGRVVERIDEKVASMDASEKAKKALDSAGAAAAS